MNSSTDFSGCCHICFGNPFYILLNRHYNSKHHGVFVPLPSPSSLEDLHSNQMQNEHDNDEMQNLHDNDDLHNMNDNIIDEEKINEEIRNNIPNDNNYDQLFEEMEPIHILPDQIPPILNGNQQVDLVYYNGPIPTELQRYHTENPELRQSPSVLLGLCNPPDGELSQY